MNEENTKFLVENYQPLYEHRQWFACGDGWFNLIKQLSESINNKIIAQDLSCRCSDVKEKYGTLRFYMDTETDEISELIKTAEMQSEIICETCGNLCQPDPKWIGPRCYKCAATK